MPKSLKAAIILIAILGVGYGINLVLRPAPPTTGARLVDGAIDISGFAQADGPREFSFPLDHGPHPDYQTEWWYYTGNLQTANGERFGYQLTFFQRSLSPEDDQPERESDWATNQIYMAHFAISDINSNSFNSFERFSRGGAGLAGANPEPYQVWLEDWQVEEVEVGVYRMQAVDGDIKLDLLLTEAKAPVLQGDQGHSQKGPEDGNASYYYSLTRLDTEGSISIDGTSYEVDGLSWMDHEFSTSALSKGQIGWDWFALQLDDGSELMLFHIRRDDGSIDPYSSGTFIAADGSTQHLSREDFTIEVGKQWRSPQSGATYPARWTITIPSINLTLDIEPYMANQELSVSYAYWEGAVFFNGSRNGNIIKGEGYIEMTGYAGSMEDQF